MGLCLFVCSPPCRTASTPCAWRRLAAHHTTPRRSGEGAGEERHRKKAHRGEGLHLPCRFILEM